MWLHLLTTLLLVLWRLVDRFKSLGSHLYSPQIVEQVQDAGLDINRDLGLGLWEVLQTVVVTTLLGLLQRALVKRTGSSISSHSSTTTTTSSNTASPVASKGGKRGRHTVLRLAVIAVVLIVASYMVTRAAILHDYIGMYSGAGYDNSALSDDVCCHTHTHTHITTVGVVYTAAYTCDV